MTTSSNPKTGWFSQKIKYPVFFVLGAIVVLVIAAVVGGNIPNMVSGLKQFAQNREAKAPAPQAPANQQVAQTSDGVTIIVDTTKQNQEIEKATNKKIAQALDVAKKVAEADLAKALAAQAAEMQAKFDQLRKEQANRKFEARYDNVAMIFDGKPVRPVHIAPPAAPAPQVQAPAPQQAPVNQQAAPAPAQQPVHRSAPVPQPQHPASKGLQQPQGSQFDQRFNGASLEQWDSIKDPASRVAMAKSVCDRLVTIGYSNRDWSNMPYQDFVAKIKQDCGIEIPERQIVEDDQKPFRTAGNFQVNYRGPVVVSSGAYPQQRGYRPARRYGERMYEGDEELMKLDSLGPRGRVMKGQRAPEGGIRCEVMGRVGTCVPR